MAKKIKRFIVFLFFSLFFSLLSGKTEKPGAPKADKGPSWNSAAAGECCFEGKGVTADDKPCCCPCSPDGPCYGQPYLKSSILIVLTLIKIRSFSLSDQPPYLIPNKLLRIFRKGGKAGCKSRMLDNNSGITFYVLIQLFCSFWIDNHA